MEQSCLRRWSLLVPQYPEFIADEVKLNEHAPQNQKAAETKVCIEQDRRGVTSLRKVPTNAHESEEKALQKAPSYSELAHLLCRDSVVIWNSNFTCPYGI
jgi:hypothetical protein